LLTLTSAATSGFAYLPASGRRALESQVEGDSSGSQAEGSDEVLIARVQLGEGDALALLFRRYARQVRSIGKKILWDQTEADDLVQDVFLYLHRKSTLFDNTKGSCRSWIIQVAYTQAFIRRRELKGHGFYDFGVRDNSIKYNDGNGIVTDYDKTVEGLLGWNGWRKIVEDLTKDQRETLKLHFFEGYTFAEIALKMGQSYANIRNHHYRGLEKLRKHLVQNAPNRR
jgi:RNA polymerase sigma-70 factor, ECF subfamily